MWNGALVTHLQAGETLAQPARTGKQIDNARIWLANQGPLIRGLMPVYQVIGTMPGAKWQILSTRRPVPV